MFHYFNGKDEVVHNYPKGNPIKTTDPNDGITTINKFEPEEKYFKPVIGYTDNDLEQPEYGDQVDNPNYNESEQVEVELVGIRKERNQLLTETDWTQLVDFQGTATCKTEFDTYRQALRDMTEGITTMSQLKTLEYPTKPTYVKA